jgi:hypothetical protein
VPLAWMLSRWLHGVRPFGVVDFEAQQLGTAAVFSWPLLSVEMRGR